MKKISEADASRPAITTLPFQTLPKDKAKGLKAKFGLFTGDWNKFVEDWRGATEDVEEESIDTVLSTSRSAGDSERLLENRDQEWRDKVGEKLLEGFSEAKTTIENQKEKAKPSVLIKKAINALSQIDSKTLSSSNDKENIKKLIADLDKLLKKVSDAVK